MTACRTQWLSSVPAPDKAEGTIDLFVIVRELAEQGIDLRSRPAPRQQLVFRPRVARTGTRRPQIEKMLDASFLCGLAEPMVGDPDSIINDRDDDLLARTPLPQNFRPGHGRRRLCNNRPSAPCS